MTSVQYDIDMPSPKVGEILINLISGPFEFVQAFEGEGIKLNIS